MIADTRIRPAAFTVIYGGKTVTEPAAPASSPPPVTRRPMMDADALACEMARIYALTLLRDIPFADLSDPQRGVRIDGATEFTLHELQTELRQLPWQPRHSSPLSGDSPLSDLLSLSVPGDADHCAASPIRCDGQPHLLPTSPATAEPVLSAFFDAARPRAAGPGGRALGVPGVGDPGPAQSMSHWLRWIEAACGASLPMPGRSDPAIPDMRTPRDLAIQMHRRHPSQAYFNAALQLFTQEKPMDPGLMQALGGARWTGSRIFTLMLNAARRAEEVCRRNSRGPRVARPGVVAARWALMQSGEDMRAGPEAMLEQAALDRLNACTPRLLHWIARLNGVEGTGSFAMPDDAGGVIEGWTPLALRQNLILPPVEKGSNRLCPALGVGRAVLAGTQVTLLKALFATSPDHNSAANGHPDLARELDKLARNVALARSIAGGFYDVENRQSLRLGQSLALTMLREALEGDGLPATLDLRDFDGRQISLRARRERPGSVRVSLRVDGAYAPWPEGGDSPAPYLTAVV
ncbi:hypothetical protein [Puniceibacterium sediminis]|uniref:Uncharacterized protein n=1 Tax=Puniceibacterium sediminis TaxID=1608407 RepID=A0A238YTW3_9RHOB|nr:hypothetical protein [Puniceibacterium sediminis]SNR73899.1 hypothetical protein SAMN06265370_11981 [Puniceibacterium sediminis]